MFFVKSLPSGPPRRLADGDRRDGDRRDGDRSGGVMMRDMHRCLQEQGVYLVVEKDSDVGQG